MKKLGLLVLSIVVTIVLLFSCSQPAPKAKTDGIVLRFVAKAPEIEALKTEPKIANAFYEAIRPGSATVEVYKGPVRLARKFANEVKISGKNYEFFVEFAKGELEKDTYELRVKLHPANVGYYRNVSGTTEIMSATTTLDFDATSATVNMPALTLANGTLTVGVQLDSSLEGYRIEKLTRDGTTTGVITGNSTGLVYNKFTEAGVYTFKVSLEASKDVDYFTTKQYEPLVITALCLPGISNAATLVIGENGTYKLNIFLAEEKDFGLTNQKTEFFLFGGSPVVLDGNYLKYATSTDFSKVSLQSNLTMATNVALATKFVSHNNVLYFGINGIDEKGYIVASTSLTNIATEQALNISGDATFASRFIGIINNKIYALGEVGGKHYVSRLDPNTLTGPASEIKAGTFVTDDVAEPVIVNNIFVVPITNGSTYAIYEYTELKDEVIQLGQGVKLIKGFGSVAGQVVFAVQRGGKYELWRRGVGLSAVATESICSNIGATPTTAPVAGLDGYYMGVTLDATYSAILKVKDNGATETVVKLVGTNVLTKTPILQGNKLYFATSASGGNYAYIYDIGLNRLWRIPNSSAKYLSVISDKFIVNSKVLKTK